MEIEKVKEIKKALEFQRDGLAYLENNCVEIVYCKDILTLINELESENERLSNALEDNVTAYEDGFQDGASLKGRIENKWVKENQQLKDRIAELEKEKEETMKAWLEDREGMFWDGVGEGKLKGYEQLKQFAERLKKEGFVIFMGDVVIRGSKVDEVLKEFIE